MKTTEIKCDACGQDLTYTGNCVDYRLVLANESKPTYPDASFVTAMGIYPALKRTYHFCELACLDHWRDRERHETKLRREWYEKWRAEHGTKDAEGHIISWPCEPQDMHDKCTAEFKAAALTAFPMERPART